MKILNVYSSNIDLVIRGLISAQNSNDQIRTYLKKSNMFFSNCELSIELANVRGFELLMLADFCSSIIVLDKKVDNIGTKCLTKECMDGTGPRYTDIKNRVAEVSRKNYQSYTALNKIYSSNSETPYELDGILPIGCLNYHVVARFEGVSLYAVLSAIPGDKLIKDRREGIFYDVNEKEFVNMIGKNFITNFFQFMETESSIVDVLSDVMINDYYFRYVHNDSPISLSHVNTPFGKLQFTGVDTVDFQNALSTLITKYKLLPNKDLSEFANVYITIHSSLKTYLMFKLFSDLVTYKPDLNINMSLQTDFKTPECITDASYASSYIQSINLIDDFRLNSLKIYKEESIERNREKERSLTDRNFAAFLRNNGSKVANTFIISELYEYIPLSSKVSYIVSASPKHFYDEISKMKNHSCFENSTEISNILSKMELFIKAIENSFSIS